MKKVLILIIVLVLAGGAGYYAYKNNAQSVVENTTEDSYEVTWNDTAECYEYVMKGMAEDCEEVWFKFNVDKDMSGWLIVYGHGADEFIESVEYYDETGEKLLCRTVFEKSDEEDMTYYYAEKDGSRYVTLEEGQVVYIKVNTQNPKKENQFNVYFAEDTENSNN